MNTYERPLAEQLQAEAARIPLPPRGRWVPGERRRPRLMPVLATIGAIALAVLVIAPVLEQVRMRERVVSTPPSSSAAASAACGPAQDQATSAPCLLIPGTLVEIVGSDGYLAASTPLVRVRLESAKMSEAFGNPALFEADARTQIEPTSPNIAATGVKVGARVLVSFDPRVPKTAAGAYLLTRFVAVSDSPLPDCLRELDIKFPPPPGSVPGTGAPSAEEAFRRAFPSVTDFKWFPGGSSPDFHSPEQVWVWVVAASGETYIVTNTGPSDRVNSWFAYPAKFVRCHTPQEIRDRQIVPGSPADSPRPDGTRG
jgi:hypothetical protein